MSSVFTRIIAGELPARFVYEDDTVVVFLSIEPLTLGHALVVPRMEVDKWTDLPAEVWAHTAAVAQRVGQACCRAFDAPRAGNIIAGFDVPHTHVHVFPTWKMKDYDFRNTLQDVSVEDMDAAAAALRTAIEELED